MGYFWAPDNPGEKLPGILSISDGGIIELEIVTPFVDKRKELGDLKRIVGEIHDEGFVTLDDCSMKFSEFSQSTQRDGIMRSTRCVIQANKAFIGIAYAQGEIPVFDTLLFSVEGIGEWVGISGIEINRGKMTDFMRDLTIVSCEAPATIRLNLDQGMRLDIEFQLSFPPIYRQRNRLNKTANDIDFQKEAKITQKTNFRLTSNRILELNEFTPVMDKIVGLLRFALGAMVRVDSVMGASDSFREDIGAERRSRGIARIYFPGQPSSRDKSGFSQGGMLFGFEEMEDDAESKIKKWIEAYDKIAPTFNLFFFAQMGSQINHEVKFLAMIQGLEVLHRRTSDETRMSDGEFNELFANLIEFCPEGKREWLQEKLRYGNEISLRRRIKRLIEPFKGYFGDKKTRVELIDCIVNTRHYLTHYDLSLESRAATTEKLEILCLELESLFQLHLLHLMGFSREVGVALVENYRPNRRRLKRF